jgi:hypothetical protein
LEAVGYGNSENKITVSDKEAHALLALMYKHIYTKRWKTSSSIT